MFSSELIPAEGSCSFSFSPLNPPPAFFISFSFIYLKIVAKVRSSIILPSLLLKTNCLAMRAFSALATRIAYFCEMVIVYLRNKISLRIVGGHPWIFANEVDRVDGGPVGGEIAEVYAHDKKFIGRGYINPKSQILVRLLTRDKNELINEEFFFRKITSAWEYRKKTGYTENCRLVFGEADFLPALIIDKFNDYFVIQTLALGMDVWKEAIMGALKKIFKPRGIYERNDVPVR